MNKFFYSILIFSVFIQSENSWALSPTQKNPVSNSFLFIENNIDNEYFLASTELDPRFSGANTWVKYSSKQISLGYMGITDWPLASSESYMDMWLENSPINTPFNGVRCTTSGSNCPGEGYFPADKVDKLGFYHARTLGLGVTGGRYPFASLNNSTFEYFRDVSVGMTEILNLNHCLTRKNYPLEEKCIDQEDARWTRANFSIKKIGHLTLKLIDRNQRVWIASDGTPTLGMNKGYCELGVVGGKTGVICKTISYSFNVVDTNKLNLIYIRMNHNNAVAKSPGYNDLKFSGDGINWVNHSALSTRISTIFSSSGEYVYAFLSREYLKSLVIHGSANRDVDLYSFTFVNQRLPESGYYEFTPSIRLSIVPRNYSISIVSSNNTTQSSGSGVIGSEKPIELEYIITTSGRRQADDITAQVSGKGTRIGGIPYCLFFSTQSDFSVPIPAFLQYVNKSGKVERKSNSCIEDAVSLNDAFWHQSPWDVNSTDDGNFYSTSVKLLFPMDHPSSKNTDSGNEWQGIVSASGEIRVSASWDGVEK